MKKNKTRIKELKCCICSEPIKIEPTGLKEYGHNAYPYGTIHENRCCDQCNWNIVIPTIIELSVNN